MCFMEVKHQQDEQAVPQILCKVKYRIDWSIKQKETVIKHQGATRKEVRV